MTPPCEECKNARRVEMSNLRRNDYLSDEDDDFSESPRRGNNTAIDRHQLHHENGEHEELDEESNNTAAAAHNDNGRIRSSSTSENFNDDDNTSSSRHGSDFPLMQRDEISRQNATTTIYNPNNNPHQKSDDIPSNEKLLGTAFCTFMTFALTQLLFAFIAGSEAMMGDSAAMIVDSITYLFNWIAERKKSVFDANNMDVNKEAAAAAAAASDDEEADPVRAARLRKRNRRKMVLQLEIIPPVISVSTLVLVTIVVTKKAVDVLQLDMHRSRDEQKRPNVGLMLVFSIFNLGLDGVNVFCFSKANHAMGYATEEPDEVQNAQEDDHHHHRHNDNSSGTRSIGRRRDASCSPALTAASSQAIVSPNPKRGGYEHVITHNSSYEDDGCSGSSCTVEHVAYTDQPSEGKTSNKNGDEDARSNNITTNGLSRSFDSTSTDDDDQEKEHANLNMCSAYTHVFADTLRSIAVIIAATLAESVPEVTPEEADATAAIVVSFLILLSLMPLIQGLLHSVSELRAILAEERSEAMFLVPPLRAPEHDASSVMELT